MTRTEADQLELAEGQIVYVRPTAMRVINGAAA
jgi:hypothetical protein